MTPRLAGLLAATALPLLAVGPLVAQEETLPRAARITLSEQLSYGDAVTATGGDALLSTTALGFETALRTPVSELEFEAGTALRALIDGAGGAQAEVDQPRFRLGYARRAADADIALSAGFRRDDIAYVRPFEISVDENGELVIPDDIFDLRGTGVRRDYNARLQVNARKQAPLSLSFGLSLDGRDYVGVPADQLFDTRTIGASAGVGLRFSEVMQGNLSASTSLFEADDPAGTSRLRQSASFSLDRGLREDLTLRGSVGVSSIETRSAAGTERVEGLTGSLGLEVDRPLGAITARLSADTALSGTRLDARLGRTLQLPGGGSLAASLGVTRPEDTGAISTVASLGVDRPLARGQFGFDYARSVTLIGLDQTEQLTDRVALSYAQPLSEYLSASLRGAYVDSGTESRGDLGASLDYALSERLSVSAGYRYEVGGAEEDGASSVFLGLGRGFDLPF